MELLSPAGKPENVRAAVSGGCDAIYAGGKDFSARSGADNFTSEQLAEAIDYCHLRGVKVYICVNTLYKNSELARVMDFVKTMYEEGADAFILQDIGTAAFIKRNFPKVKLHASTQMTAHSLEDCLYLQSVGFDRIVLSRECSLEEIRRITTNVKAEIEVFVHGALCVSYSGRCLMSSFLGGRSGNRGRCAQPCRLTYGIDKTEGYLLSPKDMMTLSLLPQIREAGVKSIKIEGRMKSAEYAAVTARAYRRHIDKAESGEDYFVDEESVKELLAVFNRGGDFSEGYFYQKPGEDMISVKTPKSTGVFMGTVLSYDKGKGLCKIQTSQDLIPGDGIEIWTKKEPHTGAYIEKKSSAGHEISISIQGNIEKGDRVYKSYDKSVLDNAKRIYSKDNRKIEVAGSVCAKAGESLKLILKYDGLEICAFGETLQKPVSKGFTPSELIRRLSKTGDTTFKVTYTDNNIDEEVYASIGGVNALRREACEKLKNEIIKRGKRKADSYRLELTPHRLDGKKRLTALVKNAEQFRAVAVKGLSRVYVEQDVFLKEMDFFVEEAHKLNIEIFAALKPISHKSQPEALKLIEESCADGYLIRTFGQMHALRDTKKPKALDYSFNITNSLSSSVFGADYITLSTELDLEAVKGVSSPKGEIVVYGRIPLMITRQCPLGRYMSECGKNSVCCLRDRTGANFPVVADCNSCHAVIYNSRPIFTLHKLSDLLDGGADYLRMEFTVEDYFETKEMLDGYMDMVTEGDDWAVKTLLDKLDKNFTNGHFYRGF